MGLLTPNAAVGIVLAMPLSAILEAAAPAPAGRPSAPTDPAIRRRYRQVYAEIERAGAEVDVAQAVASLAIHLEQHRHARIERAELVALVAVLGLVDRHMAERAASEGTLAEAIA
jgi:hypothetical protein